MEKKTQEAPKTVAKKPTTKRTTAKKTTPIKEDIPKNEPIKFYSLKKILSKGADYNLVFGERSNGKTYAALEYGLKNYIKTGKQCCYIRRWKEDLRGKRAESLFSGHTANGLIEQLTNGEYNEVFYLSGKWFLSKFDPETKKRFPDNTPFCYGFALSEVEHDKSTSFPNVTTVIFDEFLTRRFYLPDEFVTFMNVLSTIIRNRDDVKVIMLGNTVNKYCPYFTEMGLKNVDTMEQGTIDIYKFGEHGATVAVEYASNTNSNKPSNKYFCFDNSHLQMITGGKWELAVYPHLPRKYTPKDIVFTFFIEFQDQLLQGEIITVENDNFCYIHRKTTPLKEDVLTYSLIPNSKPYYKRKLISSTSKVETCIARYFATEKVFYQDNEVGEIVRNYIIASTKNNLLVL